MMCDYWNIKPSSWIEIREEWEFIHQENKVETKIWLWNLISVISYDFVFKMYIDGNNFDTR